MIKTGYLSTIGTYCIAWLVLTLIGHFAGWDAAAWFSSGFVLAALIAFWEAGKAKQAKATQEADHADV